jgi:hypothetical protein
MMAWWDPNYIWLVLVPTFLLGLGAQILVQSAFARASRIPSSRGLTGAQAARAVLAGAGIESAVSHEMADEAEAPDPVRTPETARGVVRIAPVAGALSDHYNPANRMLRLSAPVFGEPSLAAVAVAAHEAGHAIQHKEGYVPLALRSGIVPFVNGGFFLAQIAMMVGIFFLGGLHGPVFQIAAAGYALVALFSLVTLPVEFNASRRALVALTARGLVTVEEQPAVRSVLRAAALTYVAGAVTAVLQLLHVLSMGRDD